MPGVAVSENQLGQFKAVMTGLLLDRDRLDRQVAHQGGGTFGNSTGSGMLN